MDYWFRESERVWDSAHIHLQQGVRRHKIHADAHCLPAPPYHSGDKVWLSTWDIHLRLPCHKLSPCFIGPFTIRRQINDVTYQLDLPPTYCITPNLTSLCCLTSISSIQISHHPEDAAVLVAGSGRKEPSWRRGGTVRETSASSGPSILHDHSHLSSDSQHLSPRNQDQYKANFTPHQVTTIDVPDLPSVGYLPANADLLHLLPTSY